MMARLLPLAHTANPAGVRHPLVAHLRAVAEMAAAFSEPLRAADAGRYLGLWHDVGKFSSAFQAYLAKCERDPNRSVRGPDHKAAGALLAANHLAPAAMAVQGHHGGLASPSDFKSWLAAFRGAPGVEEALALARSAVEGLEPAEPIDLPPHVGRKARTDEFFLRLLFSALVDADYLDTERHFDPASSEVRGPEINFELLWERFARDQAKLMSGRDDPVSRARREIYEACLAAADGTPGIYTLTVPTGGGKTRSAMAFALRHALRNGQRRVVVAVPFVTVTEQTADEYRAIFEPDDSDGVVLEHHSGRDTLGADDAYEPAAVWQRLSAENWDAPVVVTTTVQLFESLFAAAPGRCRKLHRLARSVVILDEAQSLPTYLLAPILDGLKDLSAHYGTTVVLSTATQPAFEAIPVFREVRTQEIVPDPGPFFRRLERVTYEWWITPEVEWKRVADAMSEERQVLAVVNTKRDAIALLDSLSDPDALHLSTSLCSAHRREVLEEVRRRLREDEPCRVISTQLVEAGVDLDFPVVLRALGPLDSVIQAAGRCNREGRLGRGRVVVFAPAEGRMPRSAVYGTGADVTRSILARGEDLNDPNAAREYFRALFEALARETDRERIQELRQRLEFAEVARRFRMIDQPTVTVLVPWGSDEQRREADRLLNLIASGRTNPRLALRRLQPYLVSLYEGKAERAARLGSIAWVAQGLGRWLGPYDSVRGLEVQPPELDVLVV